VFAAVAICATTQAKPVGSVTFGAKVAEVRQMLEQLAEARAQEKRLEVLTREVAKEEAARKKRQAGMDASSRDSLVG
jgi:hypothetical protein